MKVFNTRHTNLYSKYYREFKRYLRTGRMKSLHLLLRYERQLQRLGVAATLSGAILATSPEAKSQSFQVETLVNTYTTNSQRFPNIAIDADGDFVVVWESTSQDGYSYGVYGQRYNRDGSPAGNEFQVNTYTDQNQRSIGVAMDSDGDFVVVWHSYAQDGSGYGVYGQRYNKDGTTADSEFRVNTETGFSQRDPRVAMDSDGNFVVVWASYQDGYDGGVYGQRYNSDGTIAGSEFQINSYTTLGQSDPSIAMNEDGNFVVVWASYQDGDGTGVYGQRYNSDGTAAGGEFLVNTYTTDGQSAPSVAMDSDGNFVIAWQSQDQDGEETGIYGQRYSSDGTKEGNEFQINTFTSFYQYEPSVAMDTDGDFVVVWTSGYYSGPYQDGDGYGVYGQRYNKDGTTAGGEFQINTYTTSYQFGAYVEMDVDGDFIVVWQSYEQDGYGYGVYGQAYNRDGTTLPVELLSFKGHSLGESVKLEWHTASEVNNRGFEVERSTDGKSWKAIGFVAGNGTTLEAQNYTFLDEQPAAGINYYRLQQVDFDGAFEYSEIVVVNFELGGVKDELMVYPNPTNGTFQVQLPQANARLQLYNAQGSLVKSFIAADKNFTINIADLASGIYLLKAQTGEQVWMQRVVVE
ncbi:MAG: T9SS type A sorting domain-containing protein [Saprospiraceae bacterium]|nr:T9SS type A sorting domain-containing protein [Saprospiraceae bacterium]